MPKVLFICKKRQNQCGVSVGLINSATFVANVLNQQCIESKVAIAIDGNGIDREVYLYKPTHVIIEALWATPEKIAVLLARYPKVRWFVRLHSKAAFIANEGMALEWITQYVQTLSTKYQNFSIATNNDLFNEELTEVIESECVYLPNIYQPKELESLPIRQETPEIINIGCFGAIRPLKNHLVQGIAAIQFGNQMQKRIRFHVNADRVEQQGENVLRNLRAIFRYSKHNLVEHPWMSHLEFLKIIRGMDLGMQVSLSESFNIVTADLVTEDVPVVVSNEINWVPQPFRCDPSDTKAIIRRLMRAYSLRNLGITRINKLALRYNNFVNTKIWLRQLSQYQVN